MKSGGEFFGGPVVLRFLQPLGRFAVFPNAVAQGRLRVVLASRLRKKTGQEAGKNIAAAALGELRRSGGVEKDRALLPSNQAVGAFEHNPATAELR